MKLKITEQQLKFIIENEIPDDNIMEINMDDYDGIYGLGAKLIKILRDCKLKNCNKIKVNGNFDFREFEGNIDLLQKVCDMLIEVNGDLGVHKIKSFLNLTTVSGNLNLINTTIKLLPKLKIVIGDASLLGAKMNSLPKLEKVGGYLNLKDSSIKSLPKLIEVGESLGGSYTKIESLPKLKKVGRHLFLGYSLIKNLPELETVEGDAVLYDSQIESLPMLSYVGEYLNLLNTPLGKKLKETMTSVKIMNKFGVKGNIAV